MLKGENKWSYTYVWPVGLWVGAYIVVDVVCFELFVVYIDHPNRELIYNSKLHFDE